MKKAILTKSMRRLPVLLVFAAALALFGAGVVLAQDNQPEAPAGTPIHPAFELLDAGGVNVLESQGEVSTMNTCGTCHDTGFISSHSFHSDAGLSQPGETADAVLYASPAPFGGWDPLTYRFLSQAGDEVIDLTTPEWVQWFTRHPGGGPAVTTREGLPLADLDPSRVTVENGIVDPAAGQLLSWDWLESGSVEMNCFLCHTGAPDNQARIAALQAGDFSGASTATLLSTGLVKKSGENWAWQAEFFDADGKIDPTSLQIQDPTSENCGQCHGIVHQDIFEPLAFSAYETGDAETLRTGQVLSPQRLSDSGLNLAGKSDLTRSWDVHAERVVGCTDCHYSENNPVYYQEDPEKQPDHLAFDPRRLDFGDYLYRPSHDFANGENQPGNDQNASNRTCESCHDASAAHDWLPYKEQHTAALACETCHIPEMYAPAVRSIDWTVLQPDGSPQVAYRGIKSGYLDPDALIEAWEPAILPDSEGRLAPFNLVTSWYWVYGDGTRPVPRRLLEAAWLAENGYADGIVAAFDEDGDGLVQDTERSLDTPEKVDLIAGRLAALGLENPHIESQVRQYPIHHDVATGEWATRDCRTCHGENSRLAGQILLADNAPGGIAPASDFGAAGGTAGVASILDSGAVVLQAGTRDAGVYIMGHDNVFWVDLFGSLLFVGVLAGVGLHGSLRVWSAKKRLEPAAPAEVRQVYMYDFYERLWHWLQTGAILLLLFTGLIIHRPDRFGMFSFRYVVQVHNALAAVLVVNAGLSLFYHLASGEIRQYLPRPRGFFDQMVQQGLYYLKGIFRADPHPFEKTREKKLNPLQQVTYFAILNVLLPLQIITGALMWGAQRWPEIAGRLGGLPFLAPFHTLVAWSFASFVLMHVYLTTTGHSPAANIKAMMLGWDEVEVPAKI